jgi:hypothetical protein
VVVGLERKIEEGEIKEDFILRNNYMLANASE